MFTLPILPDEVRVSLDRFADGDALICDYPGVVAYVRPMDLETASRWNDSFPSGISRSTAATQLVRDCLIRVEGLKMRDAKTGADVDFDPKNEQHFRSLPMDMRSAMYLAIRARAELSGEAEKNFGLPSASDGTNASGNSPAADAQPSSATN